MARTAWTLTDPVTLDTYDLTINPNQGGTPSYRKTISFQNTAAPDGKVLMFEGRDEPQQMSVSGVILDEALLNALVTWYEKRYAVTVEDDLGRTFNIYITSFDPKRERSVSHPWRHSYTLEYTILDWS